MDFTCKGRECVKENCTLLHPRKVGDMKKETVGAIAKHFHKRNIGLFNKWHFLKVMNKLPKQIKNLMGGKDGPSSKMD